MAESRALADSILPHCSTFWGVGWLQDMAEFMLEAVRLNRGGRPAERSGSPTVWSPVVEAGPSGPKVKLLLCGSSGKMTSQCHAQFWDLTPPYELGGP